MCRGDLSLAERETAEYEYEHERNQAVAALVDDSVADEAMLVELAHPHADLQVSAALADHAARAVS